MSRTCKISPKKAKWRKKLDYKYGVAVQVINFDDMSWEQASWHVTTEGPHSLYFVADPNGKEIEVTKDEFDILLAKK